MMIMILAVCNRNVMPLTEMGNKLCFYPTTADNEGHKCSLWFQFLIVSLWHREKPVSNVSVIFLLLRDGALKAS